MGAHIVGVVIVIDIDLWVKRKISRVMGDVHDALLTYHIQNVLTILTVMVIIGENSIKDSIFAIRRTASRC